MATDYADIRRRLRELGDRRARIDADDEELAKDIRQAVKDAGSTVTGDEMASLLRIHRTTLYRVYKK